MFQSGCFVLTTMPSHLKMETPLVSSFCPVLVFQVFTCTYETFSVSTSSCVFFFFTLISDPLTLVNPSLPVRQLIKSQRVQNKLGIMFEKEKDKSQRKDFIFASAKACTHIITPILSNPCIQLLYGRAIKLFKLYLNPKVQKF